LSETASHTTQNVRCGSKQTSNSECSTSVTKARVRLYDVLRITQTDRSAGAHHYDRRPSEAAMCAARQKARCPRAAGAIAKSSRSSLGRKRPLRRQKGRFCLAVRRRSGIGRIPRHLGVHEAGVRRQIPDDMLLESQIRILDLRIGQQRRRLVRKGDTTGLDHVTTIGDHPLVR
jgi:hypothetical protein